jgi:FkbM family methyltransferase
MVSFFKVSRFVEKAAAYSQGKGYGSGTIKQEVSAVLKSLRVKPKLVIDVGGNVGEYSKELRSRDQNLEIHIFEPASINVKKLKNAFESDSLIKINACGISNVDGDATLFADKAGSGLGSLTERRLDHFGLNFDVKENVKLIRFEDYWKSTLSNRVIDIVKIDIEGHEIECLKSFGNSLAATKVIQFEFGGCNIDTKTYFQDFWYFFKDAEFSILRITPFGTQNIQRYSEIDECFRTTNYIAVNNKYK